MFNDTICAIATALSPSGISIIRVSGADALKIVDSIFVNQKKVHILSTVESHTISYGFLLNGEEIVDEVLVSYFKGPKSFTAEDTVEINCHGGIFVTNKILEIVINAGARLAMPGEFTKRAFLNGRIDLSKAEAVMDIISSESDISLKSSVTQLRGSVNNVVKSLREKLIYEVAYIESALDDPEHYSLDGYDEKLKDIIIDINNSIKKLISSYDNGRIIKDGIKTAIVGKPNAGKSSLLNLLAGFDRAIVTDIAGTTRDVIEEKIHLGDVNLLLADTAGIRNTDNVVEQIGVKKAYSYFEDSDLIFYVVDSSVPMDDNDSEIISKLQNKKYIVIYNKTDLEALVSLDELKNKVNSDNIINMSVLNETGLDSLITKINDMFVNKDIDFSNEVIITNLRQKQELVNASLSLDNVINSIEMGMSEDFLSIDLMGAYQSLGTLIGEEMSDDLVNEIFSKFCMGK